MYIPSIPLIFFVIDAKCVFILKKKEIWKVYAFYLEKKEEITSY
jgi:hypothetical protein